jgi:GWxTD domain-containing protein
MKRSKAVILVFVFMLPFFAGCASGGMRKPIVFVDKYNNIPADIPSQFLDRYYFLIDKEAKEFKKLLTDEERQVFIDKFWADRDPDPSTPENEYKEKIDDRIDDIASERFFSTAGMTGLLFRTNGGFRGDMSKVYLLHGEPDVMDMIEGNSFVPMMLWAYLNPENGSIIYAFLFYQKGNSSSYVLFSQDSYKMDPCGAIYQVATTRLYAYNGVGGGQACPEDLYKVYNDIFNSIGKGGNLDGNIFAWALFNFSQDSSISQGQTLNPPKPASEIAKQSNARVTGEAPKLVGTAGTDYILASCEACNSMIPAEIYMGREFILAFRRNNVDWRVTGSHADVEFKVRIILENKATNKLSVIEKKVTYPDWVKSVTEGAFDQVGTVILAADELAQIPSGTYQASIYVQNTMTKKSNAWSREFTK